MSGEVEVFCAVCKKKECDQKRVIECAHCGSWVHFKCKNVLEKNVPKLRSKPYFCTEDCLAAHQSTSRSSAADAVLLNRMNEVLSEVTAIKTTVTEIERSQNFISAEFEKLRKDLVTLGKDHNELAKSVGDLHGKHHTVSKKVDQLELEVDRLTRAGITKNLVILGLPTVKGEDTTEMVRKVAASVGCKLSADCIQDSKRLSAKDKGSSSASTVPIKVTFTDEQFKEDLLAQKKAHGQLLPAQVDPKFAAFKNRIVLRDEMTSFGMNLLKEAREAEHLADYKFIWPGRNGAVLVKKSENSSVNVIRSSVDLLKLQPQKSKRPLNSSTSSAEGSSPEIERNKRPKNQR